MTPTPGAEVMGGGETLVFWVIAVVTVVGALGLLFSRRAVHAAMAMAMTMVGLGILYITQDAEFVERFKREAQAAGSLAHPHVVSVYDRGEYEGTYYIAMELLPGRTLKDLVDGEAPLDQMRVIDLGVQILQAAGFAHRRRPPPDRGRTPARCTRRAW